MCIRDSSYDELGEAALVVGAATGISFDQSERAALVGGAPGKVEVVGCGDSYEELGGAALVDGGAPEDSLDKLGRAALVGGVAPSNIEFMELAAFGQSERPTLFDGGALDEIGAVENSYEKSTSSALAGGEASGKIEVVECEASYKELRRKALADQRPIVNERDKNEMIRLYHGMIFHGDVRGLFDDEEEAARAKASLIELQKDVDILKRIYKLKSDAHSPNSQKAAESCVSLENIQSKSKVKLAVAAAYQERMEMNKTTQASLERFEEGPMPAEVDELLRQPVTVSGNETKNVDAVYVEPPRQRKLVVNWSVVQDELERKSKQLYLMLLADHESRKPTEEDFESIIWD